MRCPIILWLYDKDTIDPTLSRTSSIEPRISRLHKLPLQPQTVKIMHDIWPILLFIAISSYYVYLRDITQAFTILYLIVSNQAEPYYTISAHLQPDYITGMGCSILYLYWLLGHYDCGLEPLVVLLC